MRHIHRMITEDGSIPIQISEVSADGIDRIQGSEVHYAGCVIVDRTGCPACPEDET